MEALASSLVPAGVAIQAMAVWLILRLVRELPRGSMRLEWRVLLGMVAFFVLGYLGYLIYFPGRHASMAEMIVPGVFLMGAGFVALVARLMLRTMRDLRRTSVPETENVTDALTGLQNLRRRSFLHGARCEVGSGCRSDDRRTADDILGYDGNGLPA